MSIERDYAYAVYEACSYIAEARNNWLGDTLSEDQTDDLFNAMATIASFAQHKTIQEIVTIGWDWRKAGLDQSATTHKQVSFGVIPSSSYPRGCTQLRDTLSFDVEALTWALNVIEDVAPTDSTHHSIFRRHIGNHVANIRTLAHEMNLTKQD